MRESFSNSRFARLCAAASCSVFLLTGLSLVPHLGIQNDEALYATALLAPRFEEYTLQLGSHRVPLMVLNYLGALKAILYRPLIRAFGTGPWGTRVPMLLAGAVSLWLFYEWMRRIAGKRAAVIGCGLLAVDASYLLTTCFDWGPVALQHLLLLGGLVLLTRFWQDGIEWPLAGGFFLFGLALWDKALALWMLGGLGVAAVLMFPRQIRSVFTPRRAGVACLAFIAGALPLIIYNVSTKGGTFRDTVGFDSRELPHKLVILRITFDGSALFPEMIAEDRDTPYPHAPHGPVQRLSAALAALTGHPHHSLLLWAFGLALVLAPWAGRAERRVIGFALITMGIAWLQMALTRDAGTSVHHTILLWPMPQVVIGVSLAAASRRLGRAALPVLTAWMLLMTGSGFAVVNEYQAEMARNGGTTTWTDAIFTLSDSLKNTRAPYVFPVDWGIMDSLRLLNRGRLPLVPGGDPIQKPQLSGTDRRLLYRMISEPAYLFLTHTPDREITTGLNAKLVAYAAGLGYRPETLSVISDSYRRPMFEVYHFVPAR